MRLAGQARLGFYPAHPDAIDLIISHLQLGGKSATKDIQILDPCCGEGLAVKQIADGLGVPYSQVYAIELDKERGNATRDNMPGANVVSPASFLGVKSSAASYGLAYVNPPFDDEIGGGRREEMAFVQKVSHLLPTGGILVLVAPQMSVNGNKDFCKYLDSHYEDLRVFQWPKKHRHFTEIVLIGKRRREKLGEDAIYRNGTLHKMQFQWKTMYWDNNLSTIGDDCYWSCIDGRRHESQDKPVYSIPACWEPSQFCKQNYLDSELLEVLEHSPLKRVLTTFTPAESGRPPLPPAQGHVAMLLASGMLDGVVEDDNGDVHVVRGTAKKVEYYAGHKSTENPNTGAVKTVETWSQKICLVIRALWPGGDITTFSDEPPPEADDENGSNLDPESQED